MSHRTPSCSTAACQRAERRSTLPWPALPLAHTLALLPAVAVSLGLVPPCRAAADGVASSVRAPQGCPEVEDDDACDDPWTCPYADDLGSHVGGEVDAASRFTWRGLALSKGAVAQPSVWGAYRGVSLNLWANYMMQDQPSESRWTSIAPTLGYAHVLGDFKLEAGVVGYWTSLALTRRTAELFGNLTWAFGPFRIVLTNNVDVSHFAGAVYLGLGPQVRWQQGRWTFHGAADVAWANHRYNRSYFSADSGGFDLAEGEADVRFDITDSFYVAAHAEADVLLASPLRALPSFITQPFLWAGGLAIGSEIDL